MITHSPLKLSSHDLFHMGRRDGLIPLSGRLNPLTRREAGSNPSHPFHHPGGIKESYQMPTLGTRFSVVVSIAHDG